jgi:DNA polymerase-3 subunit alpha
LFGEESGTDALTQAIPDVRPWTQSEISTQEKTAIGFYLSVHPLDNYREIVSGLRIKIFADYEDLKPGDMITIAGIVSAFAVRQSKKGNRFCMFRLEDRSTGVKCLAWSEAYGKFSSILKNDELLIIDAKIESAEGQDITVILKRGSLADRSTSQECEVCRYHAPGKQDRRRISA